MGFVVWLHLLAAAVWVGGLITMGALVPALRKAGAERAVIQAAARAFGRVSWISMGVAVTTGLIRLWPLRGAIGANSEFTFDLIVKLALVAGTVGLAAWHQVAARDQSPRMRGMLQGLILVGSLAIVAAAVAL